jgi:hypothetical protein
MSRVSGFCPRKSLCPEKNLKKVIVIMSLIAAVVVAGAASLYSEFVPTSIATAVIAEKPSKLLGGQAAILLPSTLTAKHSNLLNMAYKMAKAEGFKDPEIAQQALLQETDAGGLKSYKVANPGPDAYFGPMQIKLVAARAVLNENPELYDKYDFHTKTDDEVKANLILNEPFNMEVGIKYLRLLNKRYGFTGRELLNAYNRGPGGVKEVGADFHYALSAEKKLAALKRR